MSLSIYTFTDLTLVDEDDADFEAENGTDFLGYERPLILGKHYKGHSKKVLGISHCDWGVWRESLAALAGWPAIFAKSTGSPAMDSLLQKSPHSYGCWMSKDPGPFRELIYFADDDGVLGAEVCAKLAKDFKDFEEVAESTLSGVDYTIYRDLAKAFNVVGADGCICFA